MRKSTGIIAAAVLAGLWGAAQAAPCTSAADRNARLVVRVFRIPGEQSLETLVPDGRGGTVKLQGYGDVTAAFPRATLFFPTELAASASKGAVAEAILDRVVFGIGGMAAKTVHVEEVKSLELVFDKDHPSAETRFEESRGEGRTSDYSVQAEFLSSGNGKILVRLRFFAGWSARGGSIGAGMSWGVVSAPFEIPESKLFLIGGKAEGAVYWLAVTGSSPAN